VAVTIRAQGSAPTLAIRSFKSILLDLPVQSLSLLVDGPATSIKSIWRALGNHFGSLVEWKLQHRSRLHNFDHPRSVLVDHTNTRSLLIINGLDRQTKQLLEDRGDCLCGHTGMYKDNTNIILDGSIP
jgi:hypothetical protein